MFSKRFWLGLPLLAALFVAPVQAQEAAPAAAAETPDPFLNLKAFNPDISAIVDMFYYDENSDEGMSHVTGEIAGFGHTEAEGDEHDHGHSHGPENGFNLRHLELQFSGTVDPYFKATAIAAVDLESAEMEVAEIETTGLPLGLKVKGGKFYSDFGYINAQHAHEWDFTDQPLIYQLTLGSHGLNDIGLQLSWLAPTPFFLLAGVEAFQGDNEFVITGKLKDWHFRDQLPKITVPTLLTFGEHETMPLQTAETMASLIPNSKLVTTPNGGHHHMIDNPDVYYKHLADFIRQVEAGTFNK